MSKELDNTSMLAISDEILRLMKEDDALRYGSTTSENISKLKSLKEELVALGMTDKDSEELINKLKMEAEKLACQEVKLLAEWYNSPEAAINYSTSKIVQKFKKILRH